MEGTLLLDRGADINAAVSGEYGTALAAAVLQGCMPLVLLLLERGADINRVSGKYGAVLGLTIHNGSTKIASFLLEYGADEIRVGGSYPNQLGCLSKCIRRSPLTGQQIRPNFTYTD